MRTMFLGVGMGLVLASASALGDEGTPGRIGPTVETQTLTYSVDGEQYTGYLARDTEKEGKRPLVLVVHEWWGLSDYIQQRTEQLAALGYVAFAVDMYGSGRTATHPDEAGSFSKAVMSDWAGARSNLETAINALKDMQGVDASRMAIIGYCFGGGVALNAALDGMPFKAAVSFHGSPGQVVETPSHFDGRVIIQNGLKDQMVEQSALVSLLDTFKGVETEATLIQYPNAMHAFTNPYVDAKAREFDLPLAYNAAADAASWQVMLNVFNKVFAAPQPSAK
ncbi:dienelactone hydrolase family protein [Kushneria konosiri]|uniref:Dienelactone hydrolase n=1 Tax=Kushneria konosiri TaxID=698828 RepID=A0A2Z2H3N4_9GAMM|nr:dienelactone hydrolase family protein [Kushneria konosiri]ARS51833.1 dienelactone hydrolase [Kushneria konosiri]